MGRAAHPLEPEDLTFYPDHDDMGQSILQALITEILRPLIERFLAETGTRVFVGSDQFIYYIKGNPKAVVAPDVYVMPGVDPDIAPRCWKTWETGVAPSFALEVMSEIDDLKDVAHCPQRHDELGTKELIVFDPYVEVESGRTRFRVHRRDEQGELVLVQATNRDRVESRELGCFLRVVGEGPALRLRVALGPDGEELVPTDAERAKLEAQRAQVEAQRAQVEAQRAQVEAQRATVAEQARAEEAKRAAAAEQARTEAEAENARLRAELEALRRR